MPSPLGRFFAGLFKRPASPGSFAALDSLAFPVFEKGSVWLVGAGPGAPGLVSLLGYHALRHADVIVHDALVSPELIALAPPGTEKIYAGKRGGKPSPSQRDITLTLVERARAGQRVLRLKGGDPFIFGRGGEECETLARENIPFRVVPGITAGIGGLAYAGIPATHRDTNQAVVFLTGHDEQGGVPQAVNWNAAAHAAPVIVMYMAAKHLGSIATKLLAAGRGPADRLAIVSNAATPRQTVREMSLEDASRLGPDNDIPTPAIVVIGPVLAYRAALDWYAGPDRENPLG